MVSMLSKHITWHGLKGLERPYPLKLSLIFTFLLATSQAKALRWSFRFLDRSSQKETNWKSHLVKDFLEGY